MNEYVVPEETMKDIIDKYFKKQQEQETMNMLLILKDFIEDIGYKISIESHTYDNERRVIIEQDSYIDYIPLKTVYDLKTTKLITNSTEYIRGE